MTKARTQNQNQRTNQHLKKKMCALIRLKKKLYAMIRALVTLVLRLKVATYALCGTIQTVGIDDLDCVEAWVCADCQTLPRTSKSLKIQMETILETQANFFKAFTVFSEKLDNKFEI